MSDTAFFCPEFLYPDTPDTPHNPLRRDVLNSFPGIWFVTTSDGELIVSASENYHDKRSGEWYKLKPKTLPNGLVVNWLIQIPPTLETDASFFD